MNKRFILKMGSGFSDSVRRYGDSVREQPFSRKNDVTSGIKVHGIVGRQA